MNNTITGGNAAQGAAMYLRESSPTMVNSIIAFNKSGIHQDDTASTLTLRHNCVYGNTAYDYSGFTNPTGIDGNISADPLLTDLHYGNMHIQPDSPCVDAGNNADAYGDSDMDGQPRVQSGTVDIGADESDGTAWPAGPYVIVRVSPAGDDANDGSSWASAKSTVQEGIDAASALGGDVWVQTGTYEERITLHRYAHVYGGFAGGETVRSQRDWVANVTTLDGQRHGSVVTVQVGYRLSVIDGFTITNGSAEYGGGLCLRYSSPAIANNTITGNGATHGGGLYLKSSFPRIANNTITGNSADHDGGGLCLESSSPTIVNNTISGSSAVYGGGGLYVEDSSPTIASNTITGNVARDGGGLCLWNSSPTVTNNAIAGNDALIGGGLYLSYSSPTTANNTITSNNACIGGGVFLYSASPTIANTIIAFNSSGLYRNDTSNTPALQHNSVYGNVGYDYSGLTDPTGTDGNISADPLFVQTPDAGPDDLWGTGDDDFGDLHLSSGSPSIDAGDSTAVPIDVLTDLDGRPRFMNDPAVPDTGYGIRPIVDMGAYERQAVLLDIHPGQCPNRLNIRSNARVQMAVVGTDDFDVTQIDTDSLVLERADGFGGSLTPWDQGHGNTISVGDAAVPFYGDLCDCQSDRRDGIDDLVLRFSTRDIVRELELHGIGPKTPVMLTVHGQLLDGTPFDASDCILTIGGRPPVPGRISSQDGKD